MEILFFFQIVAAVFVGCTLFAMSAYMVWLISRRERNGGSAQDVSGWTYIAGLLGPAITAFMLYLLK